MEAALTSRSRGQGQGAASACAQPCTSCSMLPPLGLVDEDAAAPLLHLHRVQQVALLAKQEHLQAAETWLAGGEPRNRSVTFMLGLGHTWLWLLGSTRTGLANVPRRKREG